MPSSRPVVSVVIPTRERAATLAHTLRSALAQDATDYEVLVSDNAGADDTAAVVAAVRDDRLRYVRSDRRLSMCDNWEFALQHARGRYVTYIGDDDAVLPHGIDRFLALLATTPSAAYIWMPPIYTWPIDGRPAEVTFLPGETRVRQLDLVAMARSVIRHGGWRYYELPGVYHAAVERRVLDAIASRAGRVFQSTQPDLFTCMSVPAIVPTAIHTGRPITLQGRSALSNGGSSLARGGPAVLERYIAEFGEYRIHPTLSPVIPLRARLIIDGILSAYDTFTDLYGGTPFNYEAMLAFLCKLELMSKARVISERRSLRLCHPFRLSRFLAYGAFFEAANSRRRVLNFATRQTAVARDVPDNVWEFARRYETWKGGVAPAN